MTFRDFGDLVARTRRLQEEIDALGAGPLRHGPEIRYRELRVTVAKVVRDIRLADAQGEVPRVVATWADQLENALDD